MLRLSQLATWTTDRWRSGSKEMLRIAAGNQENDGQMESNSMRNNISHFFKKRYHLFEE